MPIFAGLDLVPGADVVSAVLDWINAAGPGYGADPTGTLDSTAAIRAAVNAVASGGGVVYLPAGTYKTTGTITLSGGIRLTGDGPSVSVIKPASDFGDVITFAAAANDSSVTQLGIVYTGTTDTSVSTASTHAGIKFTIATSTATQTSHVVLSDLHITGMGQAVFAPWTQGTSLAYAQYYYLNIERLRIRSCNIGLLLNGFSDTAISDIDAQNIFGQNASVLQAHVAPVSTIAAVSPTYSAACQNLINDLGNSVIEKLEVYGGTGDGCVFQDCVGSHVQNSEFGTITGNGLTVLGCQTGFELQGVHAALNTLSGLNLTTSAVNTQELDLTGCRFENNNQRGIYAVPAGGTTIGRIRLVACDVLSNSQGSSGTYDGVVFQGQDLEVLGGAYSDYQGSPTQKSGINANQAGADYITVTSADFVGNVTSTITVSGTHVLVTGCRGVNGTGFGTFTPAVPNTGSGNAVGNGNPYPVTIYLTGQVGTHVIDINLTDQLLPADPASVVLQPNEKIYFSTTKATSWKWYGN